MLDVLKKALIIVLWGAFSPSSSFAEAKNLTVKDLGNQYKPSNQRSLGSVNDNKYKTLAASIWWDRVLQMSIADHLSKFLSKKIFRGDSPNQILIADPGVSIPSASPIDRETMSFLLGNPEFLTQVGSRLLHLGSFDPLNSVRSTLDPFVLGKLEADRKLKELLITWSTEDDYLPKSLLILTDLRSASSDQEWDRYRKLAVAISLVDDQLYPESLPHSQVGSSWLTSPMSPLEKFSDLIEADRKGMLLRKISDYSVGELFFLVGHKLSAEELAWARNYRSSDEASALASSSFSSIKYSDERVKAREYSWENMPYTLSNIAENGGICVDQAYYADAMCKASGIPSMMFAGTGDEGGHAWVGFLKSNNQWDVAVGRSGGIYLSGKTYNPQNWTRETDHDFSFFVSEGSAPARLEANLATLFWEEGLYSTAQTAITAASVIAPASPSIWSKKLEYVSQLEKKENIAMGLKTALRNKNLSPSVRAQVKRELATTERQMGRHDSARRMEKNIVEENLDSRSDISSQQISSQIRVLVESGQASKALQEYKVAIRNLPDGSRGDFFYNVVRPLAGYFADTGQRVNAMQVTRLARQKLAPPRDSLLDADLKDLENQASKTKR
jgi:tetratricopeptide (TPR) repeat protein